MTSIEEILESYFIQTESLNKIENDESNESGREVWNFHEYLMNEDYWKIFLESTFDKTQLVTYFNGKTDEERSKHFKFGISCFLTFVQANFTGPDLDENIDKFLNRDSFTSAEIFKLLSVNNEEINTNTKHAVLLLISKFIFELCTIHNVVNVWWYWRSLIIHQEVLDELSPTLLSEADRLIKHMQSFTLKDRTKAILSVEVAQLYLLFIHISKAKEHISNASDILGLHYNLIGKLGKRTKFQENDIAQLSLEVTLDEKSDVLRPEVTDCNVPENVPLKDNVRMNTIAFADKSENKVILPNTEQKLLLTIIQEMLLAKPQDELQSEELQPFIETVLSQKNTYCVRVVALLFRCKLECKNRRTIERSLAQCEEVVKSFKNDNPKFLNRIVDVFGTGMPPIWKVETQYADILLNVGLVKNSLDLYLKIKLWEEVIVCYTILKLRHKAAEIIKEQLDIKPSVKLWCLLGDATDDISCYQKAWELSKRRSHRAQRHWGQFLFVRKQYEECIPHFEKSVSINPLQANVWFRLGYAALQTDNWQTAATAYRRYTTLEPDGFEAWNNLAQAYIKIGNKRNAHQAILEALKCNYDNWKVWENLLVVSCDISNFSDVIRGYHRLLDLKEKYLNIEVLNVLVYNVCNDITDCEGCPSQRFIKKTRELLGRVTTVYPGEGYVWELYASLAPARLLRAQRLQRAYRGYTQGAWDKNPATCQQVLYVCIKLADIVLDNEVDPRDTLVNSVKLNLSSALTAIKKQDWEETKELVEQVSGYLEKIVDKLKQSTNTFKIKS